MTHFEIELEKLKNVIIKIGNLAESQVSESVKALLSEPIEGKEVKKTEHKIDKLDVKIDEICQSIFALQQPVASDLRFIMAAMQISNEIESYVSQRHRARCAGCFCWFGACGWQQNDHSGCLCVS